MSMQLALLEAGLITRAQYEAKQAQQKKQVEKDHCKMVKSADTSIGNSFTSIRSVMDHIKKELRMSPKPSNLGRLIKQFHEVADALKLKDKRRKRMHAFLARVGEGLASRPNRQEKLDFLDEAFLKIDPSLVSE